eukprot:6311044-Prymnesium_polylepis.2
MAKVGVNGVRRRAVEAKPDANWRVAATALQAGHPRGEDRLGKQEQRLVRYDVDALHQRRKGVAGYRHGIRAEYRRKVSLELADKVARDGGARSWAKETEEGPVRVDYV